MSPTARTTIAALGATAALAVSLVVATAVGSVDLPLDQTASILWHALAGREAGGWQSAVLLSVRLPRVILAALCGAGLSVAGCAMQGLFRNPLADPAVVGVSGGAALGAVLVLYGGPAVLPGWAVPSGAFAFGVLAALVVFVLASSRGKTPVATLILAGVAIGGIANALTSLVLSLSLAHWEVSRQMLAWLMGGLEGRSWAHVAMAAPVVIGGSLWLVAYARDLNALVTGEESAMSVGVDVRRAKLHLVVLASLVTASTVAVMGVVAFVGLMVPHVVRLLVGPDHRRLMPVAFVAGAVFLVWADLACRVVPSGELRLGVVTAITGGPFFLYLLVRQRIARRIA